MGQNTATISGDGFTTDIPNITPDFSKIGDIQEMKSIMAEVTKLLGEEYSKDFDSQIGTIKDYIVKMVEAGLITDENLGLKAIENSIQKYDQTKRWKLVQIEESLRKAVADKTDLAKMKTLQHLN